MQIDKKYGSDQNNNKKHNHECKVNDILGNNEKLFEKYGTILESPEEFFNLN